MLLRSALGLLASMLLMASQSADGQREQRRPTQVRIALQLYSVRDDAAKDLAGVLKQVKAMGYQGVEFAGFYGKSAEEIKRLLDENGLVACGSHTPLDDLLGEKFEKTVAFNKTIGNRYLIVPWLPPDRRKDKAAWLETAKLFNEISEKLRPHQMFTGYHNHTEEFRQSEGGTDWDIFFGNTNRRVVMQLDTGNARVAGVDVTPFVSKYPGRARTVHLKEHSATNEKALLGEGDVPWKTLLPLLRDVGRTEWFIVEQESYAYPPMECVAKCLVNLKRLMSEAGIQPAP